MSRIRAFIVRRYVELGSEFGELINPIFIDDLKAVTVTDPVLGTISVYDLTFALLYCSTEFTCMHAADFILQKLLPFSLYLTGPLPSPCQKFSGNMHA